MRRLILQEFVSIDGRASGPKDSVDFIPAHSAGDDAFGEENLAFISSVDTMLLGSVTYRMFSGYWPNVTEGKEKPFADKFNALRKVVFSKTLDRAPWGSWGEATISRNDVADEVRKLKQSSGKDIVLFGSLSLAKALTNAKLIDEYRLVVLPVVLGDGRELFGGARQSFEMKLLGEKRFEKGGTLLRYAPATNAEPTTTRAATRTSQERASSSDARA